MAIMTHQTLVLWIGKPERSLLEGSQTEGNAAVEPEHVALNVDIPAEDVLFNELHEVYPNMHEYTSHVSNKLHAVQLRMHCNRSIFLTGQAACDKLCHAL